MERSASSRDPELIHSLHQWLDLFREAAARSNCWQKPLTQVLDTLRKLLGAQVGAVRAYGRGEVFSRVVTGDPISDRQLASNEDFERICYHLFSVPQPLLVADALEGREFADPYLQAKFPNLSLMTVAWSMPGAVILLAFFSNELGHFSLDHRVLVDYFGAPSMTASYLDFEETEVSLAQGG